MKKHPGLETVDNFKSNIKSKYAREIVKKGYCVITNDIPRSHCRELIDELRSNQFEERPYRDTNLNSMRGITRSPFIRSKNLEMCF